MYCDFEMKSMVEIDESNPNYHTDDLVVELDNNGNIAEAFVSAADVEDAMEKATEVLDYYLVERD